MKTLLACAVTAMSVFGACLEAKAEASQDFTLHNALGVSINHVYVSERGNDHWEHDVMSGDVLDAGDFTKITFNGYDDTACRFDLKVVTQDDQSWVLKDIDLCEINDLTFKRKGDQVVYSRQ
jgi:hypothetical protein